MNDTSSTLRGKVAVVTGGGRGIGRAISARLATMGATTVICGRSQSTLEEAADEIRSVASGECETIVCDVAQLASVEALASRVQITFGRADILINNAGVGDFSRPLHQLAPEDWERILNTNLRGVFHTIRCFAPVMIAAGSGDIVNISSIAGKNALPNGAAYATSKWGHNGLSYSVAEELRRYNIRVTVVCPGSTQSELSPHSGKDSMKMLRSTDIAQVVAMLVTQAPQSFVSEVVLRPTQKP